jgi:hypothetical protein
VVVDNGQPTTTSQTTLILASLADGAHQVTITALDGSGKTVGTSGVVTLTKTAGGVTVSGGGGSTNFHGIELSPISSKYKDLNDLMLHLANRLIEICGGLALIAVVYSGIMYITAGGDTAKAETARKNLTWAIIGVAVAILAGVIVTIVNGVLTG